MATDGILFELNSKEILSALKRVDEEQFKSLKKRFGTLATEGKRAVVANTPVKTGFLKAHWSKKSGFSTKQGAYAMVTLKNWPRGWARYPFILEHGRPAGVSKKTGREVTEMRARPIISPVRAEFKAKGEKVMQEIVRDALRAFEG